MRPYMNWLLLLLSSYFITPLPLTHKGTATYLLLILSTYWIVSCLRTRRLLFPKLETLLPQRVALLSLFQYLGLESTVTCLVAFFITYNRTPNPISTLTSCYLAVFQITHSEMFLFIFCLLICHLLPSLEFNLWGGDLFILFSKYRV